MASMSSPEGPFLTARTARLVAATFLAAAVVTYAGILLLGTPLDDAFGRPIAQDFLAHATAGTIAASGRLTSLYDVGVQREVQQSLLGPGHADHLNLFLSPPFVAFLYAPFAALPLLAGMVAWVAISAGLIVASLAWLWPMVPRLEAGGFGLALLVTLSAQPTVELLESGQDSALSLALLAAGLRSFWSGRDGAAGAVLGLGVFKPQLFVLFPVLFLAARRWRALAAWLAVASVLTLVSLACVGEAGVRDYWALLESATYREGIASALRWKMQSIPALVAAVLPPGLANPGVAGDIALQAIAAALLFVMVRRSPAVGGQKEAIALAYALTVLLTSAANPHFFVYDCVVLVVPALVLLDRAPYARDLHVAWAALYLLWWTGPLRQGLFGELPWPLTLGAAPWAALVIGALAVRAARSLRSEASDA
jgi:hypothetical protein